MRVAFELTADDPPFADLGKDLDGPIEFEVGHVGVNGVDLRLLTGPFLERRQAERPQLDPAFRVDAASRLKARTMPLARI